MEQDPLLLPLLDQGQIEETFLLIDGLWFTRFFVLMAYRQSGNLYLLRIAVYHREVNTQIKRDLLWIRNNGYRFTGIVSDGGTGIVKAVSEVFPHAPHQLCLSHKRDIEAALGQNPHDERVKDLKALARHIWLIESKEALKWWEKQVHQWIKLHNSFLKEKRYDLDYNWWYIHKGVRRAVHILKYLPDTSFHFLDHPLMPKTTNEIEAQFGHIGKRWLAHRGMKKERWERFLKWFIYFYNKDKLADKKTKRD